jgi:hypothetical protein
MGEQGLPELTPEERAKAAANMELLLEAHQTGGDAAMLKVWNELFGDTDQDTKGNDPYGDAGLDQTGRRVPIMKNPKRFRTLILFACTLVGMIAFPAWWSLTIPRQHQLDTDLLTALNWGQVNLGKVQEVRSLLEQGADPNARDLSGVKPESLLQQMIALITRRHSSEYEKVPTALCYASGSAVGRGSSELVKLLLDFGANVKMTENCDAPALLCAASQGDISSVRLLLDHGANANVPAHYSYNRAVLSAIRNSDPEMLRLLLEHGGQIQMQKDNMGYSDLDWAQDAKSRNSKGKYAREYAVLGAQVIAMLKDALKTQ